MRIGRGFADADLAQRRMELHACVPLHPGLGLMSFDQQRDLPESFAAGLLNFVQQPPTFLLHLGKVPIGLLDSFPYLRQLSAARRTFGHE